MIQSFDTQLQVSMRALREIVAPALAGAEKHVVEQLHLVVAALDFMRQRLPAARRYHREDLELHMALAAECAGLMQPYRADLCAKGIALVAEGAAELQRPEAEIEDYQRVARRLRESVASLVAASADCPVEAALTALIARQSETALLHARVWCLPLGFELDPESLPRPAWTDA